VDLLAFAPDGKTLATGSYPSISINGDGTARLWDVVTGQLKGILQADADGVRGSALPPDGQTLAIGDGVGVRLWDMASGQLKATVHAGAYGVYLVAFTPDGKTLATDSYDSTTGVYTGVRLWDVASGQLKATLKDASGPLAFSPDSKTLATASYDSTGSAVGPRVMTAPVRLWDVASGQLKATLQGHTGPVTLAFSPDGKTLATGSYDQTARLWDVASGQLKAILKGTDAVSAIAFSPDSKTLASGTYNYSVVQLWDAASGQLKATLAGAFVPFAFSADGQTLATGSSDQTVRLWDVASGQLKATLPDAYPPLAFSTDGKTLATRDGSRHLHLWDVATGSPITLTAQTSLAQFPPWLAHPFSWSQGASEVSLLDPLDEHVLATLQALPDAPASLLAPLPGAAVVPSAGGEWITTTPDGYFEGSANLAAFVRWNVDGVLYPALTAAYWDVYNRPDLVRQALRTPGE
jgi:WD40 repeat protein